MPSDIPEEASPPPGRCGVAGPGGGLFCELRAGHTGMHEARQYPVGVVSAGVPAYWPQVSPEAGGVLDRDQARAVQLDRREPREAAAAIAAQILGRQRTGPLSDEDLGRYVADSVLATVVHPPVAGVVLSPGEARTAAQAVRQLRGSSFSGDPNLLVALRALAARLEAAQ